MSALNNQTNRNASRYFFATSEDGEQTLGLQYGTTGGAAPISTMAVTISGTGGNGVIVSEAPCYLATEFMLAEDALMGGTNSTYNTLSSINTTLSGFNISKDRVSGSGITSIESYNTNGAGGIEFLNRGVGSALQSTTQTYMNNYLSSINAPGATAFLQPTGALNVSLGVTTPFYTALGPPNIPGGRSCYGIQDLSGPLGITRLPRWTIGTVDNATGNNTGTNWALLAFDDSGAYNNTPIKIQRSAGEMLIQNISSIQNQVSTATYASVFPASKTNVEFGVGTSVPITAGPPQVLFSTPITGLNPNTQTLLNINFANSLSSAATNLVTYKVGFSTATAYTNILQSAYVPGGGWTAGGAPSATTPVGNTNICAMLDSDGVNPDGSATLYIAGALTNPTAAADTLFIKKGLVTESTRNALVWRPV
jgi:hypothetical protein